MRTKIYTKTGDVGDTGLIGGARVSKSDLRLEAYGTVDELNAALGLCLSALTSIGGQTLSPTLLCCQNRLFNVGSRLACEDEKLRASLPAIEETQIVELEKEMDRITEALPELREFILPGGTLAASHLHMARTICRRAERALVRFTEANPSPDWGPLLKYLNRIGDFLFLAAREANSLAKQADVKWQKG